MRFRQFAFNNVLRRKRTYAAHFMSSAFAVMIFFIYAVLQYHPSLQGQLAASSPTVSALGTIGLKISQYFVFVFSFLFLLYSAGAFLQVRKREFGILMMLGMSESQRTRLVFIENMIIGLLSIVTGIGVGLLFTKLYLLLVQRVLLLEQGLDFYVSLPAIGTTAGVFFVMFLVLAGFASRIGRRHLPLELIRSEEKPREEPKASLSLSLLGVSLLGAGYGLVFYFVLGEAFSLPVLTAAVGFVVLGTYFLFTQLSVYGIRALKRREKLLFRQINLLTLTDLAYRMRDNAVMFFMVANVTAVAICGIAVCLSIGDPRLTEKNDPYAFTYVSEEGHPLADSHVQRIEGRLQEDGIPYRLAVVTFGWRDRYNPFIRLSDYNAAALALGYEARELAGEDEAFVLTGNSERSQEIVNFPNIQTIGQENGGRTFRIQGRVHDQVLAWGADVYVIPDEAFASLIAELSDQRVPSVYHLVVIDGWERSLDAGLELKAEMPGTEWEDGYALSSLAVNWHQDRQMNGVLIVISVLMGVVFFTFAASFIYFRLYADLQRDEKQYQLISKLGLSRQELGSLVSRQLALMFFLPLGVGIVHSIVAFINMGLLLQFSMAKQAFMICLCFLLLQLGYFLLIRWRYLRHMHAKLI
ncbi:FtsX-like permease family protein [Paenibacillus daejeonensis]|uniref:FtsX-like permease family protein n=1 Tax=Paenibacillus daejeonensis TaxID=135193 RepID=UPI00036B0D17|nr:ABC transporter permease [Paenibacillus daejeonensis]